MLFSHLRPYLVFGKPRQQSSTSTTKQIEDFRPGYPRFSALLSAHNSFHIFRSFRQLRTRLLLIKQLKLSDLEEQLEKLDNDEQRGLFLSSNRRDNNLSRKQVIVDIDRALADYDQLIERNHRILALDPVENRNVSSIRNWLNANGCMARDEVKYLDHMNDLTSVVASHDAIMLTFEAWLERTLLRLWKGLRHRSMFDVSRDPTVHIPSNSAFRIATKALTASLIVSLLLIPIFICNMVQRTKVRLVVVAVAAVLFVAILCGLTRAKPIELFVAGATYTTVLVVFVSGANFD
ncbi:hypothetical protein T440DRAFT_426457 [Plenodomus tracheiphilus IPT5]|uniref:DUF6594 domain-containing protein n=1 Tax=Plenodomus tracheiphilus IPT5 TaxID=1408161 RepID=A0A6A7B336_9PLEO|nr:hypothetical protein T440DRAFT_426457 [Plenodomus tracheiphilus IPT5]